MKFWRTIFFWAVTTETNLNDSEVDEAYKKHKEMVESTTGLARKLVDRESKAFSRAGGSPPSVRNS